MLFFIPIGLIFLYISLKNIVNYLCFIPIGLIFLYISLKNIVNYLCFKKKSKIIQKKYSDAEFSEDRLNRYSATRIWKMNGKYLLVIGSFPSYGDETNNDPTLNNLIEIISKDPKYGGFVIINLLDNKNNPSVKNIEYIKKHLDDPEIEKVVLAWGDIENSRKKWTKYINKDILQLIENNTKEKLCIGKNKNGTPTNPGRLKFSKEKFKGLQKW